MGLFFFVFLTGVKAQPVRNEGSVDIPEVDGTYDVPGHGNMKVRVFVHNPKQVQSSALVCSDPNSSTVDNSTGWHLPSNWIYQLNTSSVPSAVGSSNLPIIAGNAFNQWSSAVSSHVSFTRGADTTTDKKGLDGRNIVAWGRTSGRALAVTYTWYYTATHQVAEVDTIFNKRFNWSWTNYSANVCGVSNTYDAQDILTHELGHWMGLDDHYTSAYVDNTMYGYGATGEVKKDTLTSGDVAGVQLVYP